VKEPLWIDEHLVHAIHARLLVFYGGAPGLRDEGLLQSALARPRQPFSYAEYPGIFEMAAAYTAGIIRNHPFVDGNKRTGFIVGVFFLETDGYRFTAQEEDATQAVMDLASGVLDQKDFAAWLNTCAKRKRNRKES
jgi:death-on-curing protein